ncbi:MAG: MMPL family transporter [Dehalococcoidia bacterium]|jgi:predicted RND superfamily exporter protein|nr:MMPL family transporter [Dehalococcoidia bacterium]
MINSKTGGGAGYWIAAHSGQLIAAAVVMTALLAIPMIALGDPKEASQDPGGRVFDLQDRIDDGFAAPVFITSYIVESRDGDLLTAAGLGELYANQQALLQADALGELAPENLPDQPYMYTYFDTNLRKPVLGVTSLADAVAEALILDPRLDTSIDRATDEQVKIAVAAVLASPGASDLRDQLSVKASSEVREIGGRQVEWWTSPGLVFNVIADNALLGGGTQSIGLAADDVTIDKEEFARNVQKALRGDESNYRLWGIAIDVNLESADEGAAAGMFITLTVIAAVAVVGISLRSYWAVALTGVGLGALMIWLKGISALVGIKGGLVIELIVPIAMVSLGVDFAVHAIRRYREERSLGQAAGPAFGAGMAGVLGALTLAWASDSIAFLSNTVSGIESVIHFGLAAAIATGGSFIVLGIVVPAALARIESWDVAQHPGGRGRNIARIAGAAGAAVGSGAAVITMVAIAPAVGAAILAIVALLSIGIPAGLRWRKNRQGEESDGVTTGSPSGSSGFLISRPVIWLARRRLVVVPAFVLLTAASVVGAMQLEPTFDVKDFFDSKSDFVIGLDKIDEHVAERGGEPGVVLVDGDLADPGAARAIASLVSRMNENPSLARGADDFVQILDPSYLDVLGQVTESGFARAQIRAGFGVDIQDADGDGLPDTREGIAAALDYAIDAGVPLDEATLIYTSQRVQTSLRRSDAGYVTILTVFLPGTREQSAIAEGRRSVERDLAGLAETPSITDFGVTGSPFTRQEQLDATTKSLQISIPVAAVAALLLLLIAMRSARYAVVTVIPIGLVVAWLYGIMFVTGFALNFVTATIGAVSIGVGIDYSIHMTQRFREELGRSPSRMAALERATRGTGIALAASAASSIVGFGIMGLAPMPLFAAYGVLTAIMIFLALAASLLVLPSLLMFVTPEHVAGDASTVPAEPG